MTVQKEQVTSAEARITLHFLEQLFADTTPGKIGVRLWDGTCWPSKDDYPATLVLNHPGALREMFLGGNEVALAEAYILGDFDIEGDIEAIFELAQSITAATSGWTQKLKMASDLFRLPAAKKKLRSERGPAHLKGRQHSIERDRQAIAYHYNLSNDFYSLWLDSTMTYSCAYFKSPEQDIDTAQANKLDYICRKLRLKPGQKLLDIGCGWGGLVLHAARNYGVDVTGITISEPQAQLANERIRAAGLQDRARVLEQDYRELAQPEGFDAIVSVGMFEHVGQELLPTYFAKVWDLLKQGGVFLNHGIATGIEQKEVKGPTFSDSYIFPDGELAPINLTLRVAEGAHFEVRDVESLREHYWLTLRHWRGRLEARRDEALKYVDEATYRTWRLYLAGSTFGFKSDNLNLYQTLLVKTTPEGNSNLPLIRADWYNN
ncbi:MAG TPA: cyclopropane-fatty-acyl-phospholipid synthase family protein [Chloroflexia bacterium]|nr:cyclopropane-fatty-acyl-phospholipid synthase family protein [Chloroflexia bacterium]